MSAEKNSSGVDPQAEMMLRSTLSDGSKEVFLFSSK